MSKKTYDEMVPDGEWKETLSGWTIEDVGFTKQLTYEDGRFAGNKSSVEGGLTLILKSPIGRRKKVIIGYTELGEWLEHEEELKG